MSQVDTQVQLRLVQAELKEIRKNASSLRSDMLQERAAAEALDGNEDVAKIIRRLEKAEATKACFTLLRKYLKPRSIGGLMKVQVPMVRMQMTTTSLETSTTPKKCFA
jgi:flagellar motor switch protein FliG